jgi:hypothetical protein
MGQNTSSWRIPGTQERGCGAPRDGRIDAIRVPLNNFDCAVWRTDLHASDLRSGNGGCRATRRHTSKSSGRFLALVTSRERGSLDVDATSTDYAIPGDAAMIEYLRDRNRPMLLVVVLFSSRATAAN